MGPGRDGQRKGRPWGGGPGRDREGGPGQGVQGGMDRGRAGLGVGVHGDTAWGTGRSPFLPVDAGTASLLFSGWGEGCPPWIHPPLDPPMGDRPFCLVSLIHRSLITCACAGSVAVGRGAGRLGLILLTNLIALRHARFVSPMLLAFANRIFFTLAARTSEVLVTLTPPPPRHNCKSALPVSVSFSKVGVCSRFVAPYELGRKELREQCLH